MNSKSPYIDIHTHQLNPDEVLSVYNLPLNKTDKLTLKGFYSLGMHPWFISPANYQNELEKIRFLAENKNIIALGECGLDKLTQTDFNLQKQIFDWHINLSEKLMKPLIIHCARAFNDLVEYRKKYNTSQTWIVHGFNSKLQVAQMLLNHGFILSFGKALKYPESNASKVIREIPKDSFFLETDDSGESIEDIYNFAGIRMNSLVSDLKREKADLFEKIFNNNGK